MTNAMRDFARATADLGRALDDMEDADTVREGERAADEAEAKARAALARLLNGE